MILDTNLGFQPFGFAGGDDCFDKCVRAMLSGPRPPYNDFSRNGGINCQDYAESVIEHCKEVAAVGCGML